MLPSNRRGRCLLLLHLLLLRGGGGGRCLLRDGGGRCGPGGGGGPGRRWRAARRMESLAARPERRRLLVAPGTAGRGLCVRERRRRGSGGRSVGRSVGDACSGPAEPGKREPSRRPFPRARCPRPPRRRFCLRASRPRRPGPPFASPRPTPPGGLGEPLSLWRRVSGSRGPPEEMSRCELKLPFCIPAPPEEEVEEEEQEEEEELGSAGISLSLPLSQSEAPSWKLTKLQLPSLTAGYILGNWGATFFGGEGVCFPSPRSPQGCVAWCRPNLVQKLLESS